MTIKKLLRITHIFFTVIGLYFMTAIGLAMNIYGNLLKLTDLEMILDFLSGLNRRAPYVFRVVAYLVDGWQRPENLVRALLLSISFGNWSVIIFICGLGLVMFVDPGLRKLWSRLVLMSQFYLLSAVITLAQIFSLVTAGDTLIIIRRLKTIGVSGLIIGGLQLLLWVYILAGRRRRVIMEMES